MKISVDDGCRSDIRLSELCQKYEIKLIIYLPVEMNALAEGKYTPLSYTEAYDLTKKHELGSHTITHRHLTRISPDEAFKEIVHSKLMLEALYSTKITKFCPPRGYTNPELNSLVYRYYEEQRLTKAENLVHIHPNSGANKNLPWREAINKKTTELWCHGWELDKYNLWDELEDYLKEAI